MLSGEVLENKLLVIVSKIEELDIITNSLSNYDFIVYKTIDDITNSEFKLINDYSIILDSSGKLYNFLIKQKFNIETLDDKYSFITYEQTKIFESPKLPYLFDRSNWNSYSDEHKKEIMFVISRLFNLFAILENIYFKQTTKKEKEFKDIIVESKEKKLFKLVEEIPKEKEEGYEYLELNTIKELNKIFNIIDSIVKED